MTLVIISPTCAADSLRVTVCLAELLDRAPVRILGLLEEGRLHQHAAIADRGSDLRHLRRRSQQLALGAALSDGHAADVEALAHQVAVRVVDAAGRHLVGRVVEPGSVEPNRSMYVTIVSVPSTSATWA